MLNLKTFGFTLAEVLITLGIIGVVAAMTVPNLITKYKNNMVLSTLKKQYAELTQVIKLATQDADLYSLGENWQDTNAIVEAIKPYLKWSASYPMVSEYNATKSMCYVKGRIVSSVKGSGGYVWLTKVGISNPIAGNTASIELSNGACIGFNRQGASDRTIILDINGPGVLPNMMGKDVFVFTVTEKNELRPKGYNLAYKSLVSSSSSGHGCACDKTTNKCGAGMYCAARIMHDGWKINY